MNQIVIFVIGVIIGAGAVWIWCLVKQKGGKGEMPELMMRQAEKKEVSKAMILQEIDTKSSITNGNAQKLLGVSDATVTRYMDELEKEGKIKQVGKRGGFVYYEKA